MARVPRAAARQGPPPAASGPRCCRAIPLAHAPLPTCPPPHQLPDRAAHLPGLLCHRRDRAALTTTRSSGAQRCAARPAAEAHPSRRQASAASRRSPASRRLAVPYAPNGTASAPLARHHARRRAAVVLVWRPPGRVLCGVPHRVCTPHRRGQLHGGAARPSPVANLAAAPPAAPRSLQLAASLCAAPCCARRCPCARAPLRKSTRAPTPFAPIPDTIAPRQPPTPPGIHEPPDRGGCRA